MRYTRTVRWGLTIMCFWAFTGCADVRGTDAGTCVFDDCIDAAKNGPRDGTPVDDGKSDGPQNADGPPAQDGPSTADAAPPDAMGTPPDASTQFSQACVNGSGYSMMRFGFQGTFIDLDHWDTACQYDLSDQACQAYTFGSNAIDNNTAVSLSGNGTVRARFSVSGLQFSQATVYVLARGVGGTSRMTVQSQLHGQIDNILVPVDFNYTWYAVDWTGYLLPGDQPSLTAVDIERSSGTLGVKSFELCVQ